MKSLRHLLIAGFLLFSFAATAQEILSLKNGKLKLNPVDSVSISFYNSNSVTFNDRSIAIISLEHIPTPGERILLASRGIELLNHISGTTYSATIVGKAGAKRLQQSGIKNIIPFEAKYKMDVMLAANKIPSYAVKIKGTIDVLVSCTKTFSVVAIENLMREKNIEILSKDLAQWNIISLRIPVNRLAEIASLPCIDYIQPLPPADQPLNHNSRAGSNATVLNASIANGGKGLNGEGITIGIGDNGDVQFHPDFFGRLINHNPNFPNAHGVHVTGTAAGAGNVNELYRGYASKSTIVSQSFSNILVNAATYVNAYGMVVTNNSYGNIVECNYHGTYDLYARVMDQQAFELPTLQHVFASGNSGNSTCAPYGTGFHTVLGGFQVAKNVITVGATTDSGMISSFSSRGPVKDGRIKPEITAMGQGVISTVAVATYASNNGTSMATPAVTGGVALLYQRYKQLHGNTLPPSGLIKALLLNGASDRGNAGPDFSYGFGWMNLLRSVEMMEQNNYATATVAHNITNTHTINVPANTAQVKIMLYWHDPAANLVSSKALVHDLDLEVKNGSLTFLPKLLDTTAVALNAPANTGADHLNNVEQVVIDAPAAGSYTIDIKGTEIAQTPTQQYFLVYDIIPVSLKLTKPFGGDNYVPSEKAKIVWEAYGDTSNTFLLQYSIDDGINWINIASGINGKRRLYTWTIPNEVTDKAMVRIINEATGLISNSGRFTIASQPAITLDPVQCEGYINMNWSVVTGAAAYEVMLLRNGEMQTITTVDTNNYLFKGLIKDSTYWITVRPLINGKPGRRAIAISRRPDAGNCAGTISDNDLKINSVVSPKTGRKFTSTQLSSTAQITIQVKNLDDVTQSDFKVGYSINGGSFIIENVNLPVSAGAIFTHTFSTTADLSAPGNYVIKVFVANNIADPVSANDTLTVIVKHIDNPPLTSAGIFDNLETAVPQTYIRDTMGLEGVERYDFKPSTVFGRLRTYVPGFAYSGTKAFTVDASALIAGENTNYITGTFNLSSFTTTTTDFRLDFLFAQHNQVLEPTFPAVNKVWIRGNDLAAWIKVYELDSNQADPGVFKKSPSIEVSRLLAANGQEFSSSFQVRWGQTGYLSASDKENASGYTFDDIRLYSVVNDLQLVKIEEPAFLSCALTSATAVKINVRNSSFNSLTNIPVRYRVNNGPWVSETIAAIGAGSSLTYSFTNTYNFSALGIYIVEAIVDHSADNFHENDTMRVTVRNAPVINSFPHLENFESNNGYWIASGKNSSWQYGTPASAKIKNAAGGSKAWKTGISGTYNDNELSYLYSPCYNIGALNKPTLSFSVALDIEDCGSTLCDAAWMEYSTDGSTWQKLGSNTTGYNWYNKPGNFWSVQNYTRWHVATIPLPKLSGNIYFRFVMSSDPGVVREGIAIDDIHVYDLSNPIYDTVPMPANVLTTISGSNWQDIIKEGKIIASVNPKGQLLGNTAVQLFVDTTVNRFANAQYYHPRNITIKPANRLTVDSVGVRYYFTDRETEKLIAATGCGGCAKPSSAYEMGVSKYTDADTSFENGNIADNLRGDWQFINRQQLQVVPFDKGYYAEFYVKDFSEFWLSNGGLDKTTPLPVKMMEFTAQRISNDGLLVWKTAGESNVLRFEIEVSVGNSTNFNKIAEVAAAGSSTIVRTYNYTDAAPGKTGIYYYRLKIINYDGSFDYSNIRWINYSVTSLPAGDFIVRQLYPNPSKRIFQLVFTIPAGQKIYTELFDATGRLIQKQEETGLGNAQKIFIDLEGKPAGIYMLSVSSGGVTGNYKLYKQ